MPHHKSAMKRVRTSKKENARNRIYRTMMRRAIRRVRESDGAESVELAKTANAILDRLASKGIIHRNTAARRKSRLAKFVASRSNPS